MSIKGKTLWIQFPSPLGLLQGVFSGRHWTLKFRCGSCLAEPIVQHNENKNWHKCPVCNTVNILTETSYFDL